ncbi:MAG: hypothetical protein AAF616_13880 [Bacteroidota bacterium]
MPRFPSLFRLPKHQQFQIKPRYYDPIKEEIQERTERIREEIDGKETGDYQPTRINFKRKNTKAPATSLMQLGIATSLGGLIFGWLEFGNDIFQIYLIVILGIYLLYRVRKMRSR